MTHAKQVVERYYVSINLYYLYNVCALYLLVVRAPPGSCLMQIRYILVSLSSVICSYNAITNGV